MKEKKIISTKNILQAIAYGLIFLVAVVYLAPFTRLWPLGFGPSYLFGLASPWLLLPFLLLLFIVLAAKGTLKGSFLKWNIYVGFAGFLLGLTALLSHLAYGGKESFGSYSLFADAIAVSNGGANAINLYLRNTIGGGALGFALASLFEMGGSALAMSLPILLLLTSSFLIFYKVIFAVVRKFAAVLQEQKAEKAAKAETDRLAQEAAIQAHREMENAPLSEVPSNAFYVDSQSPSAPLKKEEPMPEEIPVMSRSEMYGKKPVPSIPQEVEPTSQQKNHPFLRPDQLSHSGLQEAVFIPDEETEQAYKSQQNQPILETAPLQSAPETASVHSNEIVPPEAKKEASELSKNPVPETEEILSNELRFDEPIPEESPVAQANPAPSQTSAPSFETPAAPIETPSLEGTIILEETAPKRNEDIEATFIPNEENEVKASDNETPMPEVVVPPSQPLFTASSSASTPAVEVVKETPISQPKPFIAPKEETVPQKPLIQPTPAPTPIVAPSPAPAPSEPAPAASQPKATSLPPYQFPPTSLLLTYPAANNTAEQNAECQKRAAIINQAFTDLGAGAQVVGFTIGPSVTRFDLQTDKDVSVSSIGKYIQDISVRLGGVATRYEEVVRGKATSGLEIANTSTTTVSLLEMISHLPSGDKNNLMIPFGKSISGDYVSADLSDFPHMLVSGSTGSGKSIFMHGLIMALIMRNRPEDLKLVVVDPKRVEMAKYKDLPHLLCPIIKEPSQAKVCFQKLIDEMERRYTLFELSGVSNIRQFNKDYAPEVGVEKLPFIVVVVDEYADLVDSCKDIGDGVVRLAQKARAAGIHLVIATQRPSVQVITGVIKANLPVRVALSVSSSVDSITILGQGGAEDLVGHGDMLVDCSLVARNGFTRCQGCFVDNKEIKAVTDFIKSQAQVHYDPNFLDLVDHEAEEKAQAAAAPVLSRSEMQEQESDDLYNTIKTDIMQQQYTSISRIQRSYGIGFPRAGRLFARLQREGVVALQPDSASSSKGCRVLIHDDSVSQNPGSSDETSLSMTPPNPNPGGNPQ